MSLPIFPSVEDILTIMMAELPSGVYSEDRADAPNPNERSYSSSELRAQAQMLANLYSNLQDIWENKWVSTMNPDSVAAWENELFAEKQDGSLPFLTRQNNLLAKKRARGSISLPAVAGVVSGILQSYGYAFEILPYNGCNSTGGVNSAWILDESPLDQFTYLSALDPLRGAGRDMGIVSLDCSLNYAAAGLNNQDLLDIQATAYTYAVAIYGVVDSAGLALLDKALTAVEPARSTHVIINNAILPPPPDVLDGGPFVADTLLDAIDFGLFTEPPSTYDVYDFGSF